MESIRQKQIGEVIRRYFSMALTEEGGYIYGRNKLVTVTGVKMTPDLLIAKVYVSVYGSDNKSQVIDDLEHHRVRLRQLLAQKIGKQMRRLPDLEFYLDETVDEMYRVNNLLDKINEDGEETGKE